MKKLVFAFQLSVFFLLLFASCSDDLTSEESELQEETPTSHSTLEKRSCGHTHHMENLLQDPNFKKDYEKRIRTFKEYSEKNDGRKALCASPTVVPVAVHYQGVTNPNTACLVSLAEESISALNADFQGSNSDISQWTNNAASSFPGINFGEACLEFVLANQNHPSGYGLSNGDLAVTVNATTGDQVNNWAGYLNIFVIPNTGLLGYAPLGGSGNGDGVVIDAGAFGTGSNCGNVGSSAPYNLGRTLTHELGHYLFLDHIWGNGCGQDDGISDTPNQASDSGGCPNIGASSCGSTDLHMNYMDYTNDACMYMFTAGQATVTTNYVSSNLSNLTGNASTVISGSTGGGNGGGGNQTCDTPVASSQVQSSTSAIVSWSAISQANSYRLQYRATGTTTWTTVNTAQTTSTISGLTASTTYQYRVRTTCSSGNSAYTAVATFTTSAGNTGGNSCDKPGFTSVEYVSANKSKVTWEQMTGSIRYQIRYRKAGTSRWKVRNVTQPSITLDNLQSGATYQYRVRTRCSTGWTSFTTIETFLQQQSGGGGGNNGCNNNTLTFEITLDQYGSETTWELINGNNQVVESGGPYSNNQSGTKKTKTFCIPDGCYTLYVDDSYGDGICCDYGDGSFELLDNTGARVGYSNGQFGNFDYIDFCVDQNVVTFTGQEKDQKNVNLAKKASNTDFYN